MRFGSLWILIKNTYIFIMAAWIIVANILKRSSHYKKYLTISAGVYVLVLLYVTLLGRTASTEYQMELSFLWEYRLMLRGNVYWFFQIFDNMMLFLPMGWLYGGLRAENGVRSLSFWIGAAVFGVCVSFAIECSQLILKLGLFEFDDILNNTVGMMVGYGLYRVIGRKTDGFFVVKAEKI